MFLRRPNQRPISFPQCRTASGERVLELDVAGHDPRSVYHKTQVEEDVDECGDSHQRRQYHQRRLRVNNSESKLERIRAIKNEKYISEVQQ